MTGASEMIAKSFHEAYENLAPNFDYETREASAKPWDQVPEHNRNLMIATVQWLVERGVIAYGPTLRERMDTPQETTS